jgi:rhomboid protease GlpG
MRLIGHLVDESMARRFADFLYIQGIQNQLEHEKPDGWGIWVRDEDKLNQAAGLLTDFRTNPKDPKYRRQEKAEELRSREEKENEALQKKVQTRRHLFQPLTPYGFGPLTFALIIGCLAAYAVSGFSYDMPALHQLFMSEADSGALPEIRHGEIWRLVTPIFIHYSALHIIFNLMWLRELGSMVEGRQSSLHLLLLVLVTAVGSNLAQFYYTHSPIFGGMSGVVYGLLGYIWMRGKFDPASGLSLHPSTMTMMLFWFLICLAGIIPHIANGAHAGGLVIGMLWGYLSSLKYR